MSEKSEQEMLKSRLGNRRMSREEKDVESIMEEESIMEDMHYEGRKGYKPRWSYLKLTWNDLKKFIVEK